MGPTLIYDKSAIHSFSEREACWLTNPYNVNMTPVLFMEVMADLKKCPNDLPLSAQQVQALAKKFSIIDTYQSVHHREIWANNLIGHHVPMDGRTMVGGAVPLTAANGKRGLFIDESPEEKALHRWQEGAFEEFERELADRWRDAELADRWRDAARNVDLQQFVQIFRKSMPKERRRFETLEELVAVVEDVCRGIGGQYRLLLNVPRDLEPNDDRLHAAVLKRWKTMGSPLISQFAPYALYCHKVNLFFYFGVGEGPLGTRATNLIDLQYLYYLPFSRVFTSGDKFHTQIVPFFLQPMQLLIQSAALKVELKTIAEMWDATDKSGGTVNFIRYPLRGKGLVSEKVWDHCVPNWRDWADAPRPEHSPESDAKIMERIRPMMEAIELHQKQKKQMYDKI